MTDFSHLSSTQRKTAEIVLKTKDWLESQDETVDAASMRRASAQFRENGLSRALLYSPTYRSIWDDAEQGTSSSNHRKVKRIAAENDKLKTWGKRAAPSRKPRRWPRSVMRPSVPCANRSPAWKPRSRTFSKAS